MPLPMRLPTPMPLPIHLLPARVLLLRVGPFRYNVANCRFSSSASTALAPPPTHQNSDLPRTIASLLHSAAQNGQLDTDTVTVHGWIKSIRRMKSVCFAHITDGSTSLPLQAVLTKLQAAGLSTGSSIQIAGKWKPSLPGADQQNELVADEVRLLGGADPETYPLQKKYHTPKYLRTLPHLRPRIPLNTTILHLRSFVSLNLASFFAKNEFVQCYTPIITSSDCEGAGEVFKISANEGHFFKSPKYLTVSAQLHLEALASALPRVWTLSPTFRAEKSDTNRHLSEFYMLEAELSFVETLDPLLDLIENMIRQLVSELAESRIGHELLSHSCELRPQLEARWKGLMEPARWKRLTYSSAIKVLEAAVHEGNITFEFPVQWGESLQSEHEKYLAALYNKPVFVTDYPREIKPFYMLSSLPESSECRTVACFDLLFPDMGELIGGSLREHRYDELVRNMKAHGLVAEGVNEDQTGLKWYTELRKWGTTPHGGFGMGMDRLLCYLTGVENIREVVAFPRWVGRCDA